MSQWTKLKPDPLRFSGDVLGLAALLLSTLILILLGQYYYYSLGVGAPAAKHLFWLLPFAAVAYAGLVLLVLASQFLKLYLIGRRCSREHMATRLLLPICTCLFILLAWVQFSSHHQLLVNGFIVRLEQHADFAALKQWLRNYSYAPDQQHENYIHIPSSDWPRAVQQLNPSSLFIKKDGHQRILTVAYGGPLHPRWGMTIRLDSNGSYAFTDPHYNKVFIPYKQGIAIWYVYELK